MLEEDNRISIKWSKVASDGLFAAVATGLILALRKKSLKTAVIESIASIWFGS